jgi:hypothetical protein
MLDRSTQSNLFEPAEPDAGGTDPLDGHAPQAEAFQYRPSGTSSSGPRAHTRLLSWARLSAIGRFWPLLVALALILSQQAGCAVHGSSAPPPPASSVTPAPVKRQTATRRSRRDTPGSPKRRAGRGHVLAAASREAGQPAQSAEPRYGALAPAPTPASEQDSSSADGQEGAPGREFSFEQ